MPGLPCSAPCEQVTPKLLDVSHSCMGRGPIWRKYPRVPLLTLFLTLFRFVDGLPRATVAMEPGSRCLLKIGAMVPR